MSEVLPLSPGEGQVMAGSAGAFCVRISVFVEKAAPLFDQPCSTVADQKASRKDQAENRPSLAGL